LVEGLGLDWRKLGLVIKLLKRLPFQIPNWFFKKIGNSGNWKRLEGWGRGFGVARVGLGRPYS